MPVVQSFKKYQFRGSFADIHHLNGCTNAKPWRGHPRGTCLILGATLQTNGRCTVRIQTNAPTLAIVHDGKTVHRFTIYREARFSRIGRRIRTT